MAVAGLRRGRDKLVESSEQRDAASRFVRWATMGSVKLLDRYGVPGQVIFRESTLPVLEVLASKVSRMFLHGYIGAPSRTEREGAELLAGKPVGTAHEEWAVEVRSVTAESTTMLLEVIGETREQLDRLQLLAIYRCRVAGLSWDEIGDWILRPDGKPGGVSGQAAQQWVQRRAGQGIPTLGVAVEPEQVLDEVVAWYRSALLESGAPQPSGQI